jgi:hypothetical protein
MDSAAHDSFQMTPQVLQGTLVGVAKAVLLTDARLDASSLE